MDSIKMLIDILEEIITNEVTGIIHSDSFLEASDRHKLAVIQSIKEGEGNKSIVHLLIMATGRSEAISLKEIRSASQRLLVTLTGQRTGHLKEGLATSFFDTSASEKELVRVSIKLKQIK